ncbi:putative gdsl esterase lipase protein [Alternaria sp. MG1]|jgi:hypothetical protein|nr:putative gdsl esterase lipase protein [Alternaria sp. MG1]
MCIFECNVLLHFFSHRYGRTAQTQRAQDIRYDGGLIGEAGEYEISDGQMIDVEICWMSEKHLSYGRWLNAPSKQMDDGVNRKHEKVRGIKERSLVHVGVCAFNSIPHVVFGSRLWLTILGRSPILRTRKAKEA